MNIGTYNLQRLPSAVSRLMEVSDGITTWCFEGEMGAGKTTLIAAICKVFGTQSPAISPTYSLINEYDAVGGIKIFHFDFYRIKTLEEAAALGLEEYFFSGQYCLIEWPSMIAPLLPENYLNIKLEKISDTERKIEATLHLL